MLDPLKKHSDHSSSRAVVTPAEALRRLQREGISIKGWAESRGFHFTVVYSVLSGRRKCMRGQSHEVAVALGIKDPGK